MIPKNYKEMLRTLLELLSEDEDATPEEIDEYLLAAGYDPDELVERMRQRMQIAMDKSPLNPKNQEEQS